MKEPRQREARRGDALPVPDDLPEEAFAAALSSLPGVGPARLRALVAGRSPRSAWVAVCDGRAGSKPWNGAASRAARTGDVAALWKAYEDAGVGVLVRGAPGYPRVLEEDPEAPAVLFSLGDPAMLDTCARVALVGTRSATRYGLGMAAHLGADLAASGVVVVSGLALGIDGAAHEGAVAAWQAATGERDRAGGSCQRGPTPPGTPSRPPSVTHMGDLTAAAPVAVVAGSLSTPYPPQHASLWRRVAAAGAVLSEAPLGASDLAWRFPMRNRIIAALSDVVVVVESHGQGGALHTVQASAARGIPVGAVPGSVRSPASAGTNALLADGCFVVRDAADVLVAVGLATAAAMPVRPRSGRHGLASARAASAQDDAGISCDEGMAAVLDALGWEPASLEELTRTTSRALDDVAAALERLRRHGVVEGTGGVWRRV